MSSSSLGNRARFSSNGPPTATLFGGLTRAARRALEGEVALDAHNGKISAGYCAREAAQQEGEHHDVPDRAPAQRRGEIEAVQPVEEPAVGAPIGIDAS